MNRLQKYPILLYSLAGVSWLTACIFFYWLYTAYDGAVKSDIVLFFLLYPLLVLLLKGLGVEPVYNQPPNPNSLVARISFLLLFCLIFAFFALLIKNPYELSRYLFLCFAILASGLLFFELRSQKNEAVASASDPILEMCRFEIIFMPILILTALCYLAVVQPTPLATAKAVAPQDMTYISLSRYGQDGHPLGIYWFSDYKVNNTMHLNYFYVDVLTGEEVCADEILR